MEARRAALAAGALVLFLSWAGSAAANSLWIPVQVVDCDNRPVKNVSVALWGCVDAAGSSELATTASKSSVVYRTDASGFVVGGNPDQSAGACDGLKVEFCFGSADHPCKISVLTENGQEDQGFATTTLFSTFSRGVKEYVVTSNPICRQKSGGQLDKCNDCGADQYCFSTITVLRPTCCAQKVCYCM